jgi:hypothetical protein
VSPNTSRFSTQQSGFTTSLHPYRKRSLDRGQPKCQDSQDVQEVFGIDGYVHSSPPSLSLVLPPLFILEYYIRRCWYSLSSCYPTSSLCSDSADNSSTTPQTQHKRSQRFRKAIESHQSKSLSISLLLEIS